MMRSSYGPKIYLRGAMLQLIHGGFSHHKLFLMSLDFFGFIFGFSLALSLLSLLDYTLNLISLWLLFLLLECETPFSVWFSILSLKSHLKQKFHPIAFS